MNSRSIKDLETIKKLEDEISSIRDRIRSIKEECPHYDYACEYRETLAHEFTPKKVCIVCDKILPIPITDEEKITLLKKFYEEMEFQLDDSKIDKMKNGFSL